MPNFELKKDCVSAGGLNLALDSIVIVVADDRTQGFRPMVSSAVWGKAPAARKKLLGNHVSQKEQFFKENVKKC